MAFPSAKAHTAFASPSPSIAFPKLPYGARPIPGTSVFELEPLTPPTSMSPELAARSAHDSAHDSVMSPPLTHDAKEADLLEPGSFNLSDDNARQAGHGMPLSQTALSDLDGAQAITPSMLAKHYLPAILLGHGHKPIRYIIGELTQSLPGFSRIAPARARRIVVAALETRSGGGPDGNITFNKIGWGRWDAQVKGAAPLDYAFGSMTEDTMSPPRSEHSYVLSHADSSNTNTRGLHRPSMYREHHSGISRAESNSLREEDELDMDMDMDVLEDAADKMSLDGDEDDDLEIDEETDDDDWAAVGFEALRKASLPPPNAPKHKYRAFSIPYNGPLLSRGQDRRLSGVQVDPRFRFRGSTSVPSASAAAFAPKSPEESAALALISLGSM